VSDIRRIKTSRLRWQLKFVFVCRGILACVALLGVAPAFGQAVTVSPSSLSFGTQALRTSSSAQKVTLTNAQTTTISISSITSSLVDFTRTTNCSTILAAGRSCTISVTFTPTALGLRTGTLTVTDSGSNSPQIVALSGTGVAAVTVTPSSLSFGNQTVGVKSLAATVTVTNNQSKSLTINSITTSLSDYTTSRTCPLKPKSLAARATCMVSVFFTPAASGTRTATLTISDNASVSPTVSLTGTGILPVTVVPSGLNFTGQALGTTSPPQVVTLTNNQSSPLTINSITSATSDFAFTSNCPLGPVTLAAGAFCAVSVTFSPKATGARTGSLTFNDNASTNPQNVSLSGTGTAAALVSIAVTPANPSFALGTTQQLQATGTYSDGSTQDLTNTATWSAANPAIATVNAQGLATSVTTGSTSVTATSASISGSTTLNVTPPALVSIVVTPAIPSDPLGTTQQFTATGTFTDGSTHDITTTVLWSSDTTTVATISNATGSQGLATTVSTGSTKITAAAASGSTTASTTLTVTAAALVSIVVTPVNPSIALGTTQQFAATGTYTNNSTQDLTSTATWASDTSSTVTINKSGLATSTGIGTATISATSGTVIGSTVLTVTTSQANAYCGPGDAAQFGSSDGPAALPQTCYYTALAATPSPGTVRTVTDVISWNSAWAAAVCGDIIQIPAGAVITAPTNTGLTVPTKTCDAHHYITVETSALANLPAEGARLTPCYAGVASLPGRPSYPCPSPTNDMAKIVAAATSGAGTRAITISANSAYIRFIGLEITRSSGSGINSQLVNMNAGGINHIVFDRVWGHGNTTDETTRFASLNRTSYFALIDSTLTDFWCVSVIGACIDAQAISGGANPNAGDADNTWKIVNNFLEGAAETIDLGGGSAVLTPTSLEIRLNHMFKPLTWNPADPSYNGGIGGHALIVKNLWETKNSDRVLLEANILENVWAGFSQKGNAITLTPKSQSGGTGINLCSSCVVTNTTVRYNKIRTAMQPFQIANVGNDNGAFAMAGNSYSIHDNVADNQGYATCYSCPTGTSSIELIEAPSVPASFILHDVTLDHNTIVYASGGINPAALLGLSGAQSSAGTEMFNIGFTNNLSITRAGTQNSIGSGITTNCAYQTAAGAATVDACWNPQTFGGNALVADGTIPWPGTNCTAETSYTDIFVDYANGDYHVKPTSACALTGTDGIDPGANIDLVNTMTEGVQ
jgi:Bacterial Ig-like domain (group 2)/Abnormal spindle-like microcephaly-assoc'd, ASPM-SPD-2-Hydin